MLARLLRPPRREAAYRLYTGAVEAARQPAFYARLGVPDTLDGRFELVALHVALVLRRLKTEPSAKEFAQEVFDAMFADLDRALREMGTGDLSVGKQVKRMAAAFYGRALAYERGLAGSEDLAEALRRNLYGTIVADAGALAAMTGWVRDAAAALAAQTAASLTGGAVAFPPAPVVDG
jgi:cytochrome b pre-mRNA-processing protein 3